MAKLQNCQFIEVKIDNKVVAGTSEESTYKDWMEGYVQSGLASISDCGGIYFSPVPVSALISKQSGELYAKYLSRGYKNVTITVAHRGSDKLSQDYEIQRTVYEDCNFHSMVMEVRNESAFLDFVFSPRESVEVTFNVPNTKGDGLEKVGPTKFNIPQKKIV